MNKKTFLFLIAILTLSSCTSISPSKDFDRLKRTNKPLIWKNSKSNITSADTYTKHLLDGNLTIEKAIKIALINNPDLQAKYESLGISAADLLSASRIPNPTIETKAFFPANSQTRGSEYEFSLRINATNLIKMPTQTRLAKLEHEKTLTALQGQINDIIKNVKYAYYKHLYYKAEIDNNAHLIRLQSQLVKELKKNFEAGLESEIHIQEAMLELNLLTFKQEQLINQKNETQIDLLSYFGLDPLSIKLNINTHFSPPHKMNINTHTIWHKIINNNSNIKIACLEIKQAEENILLKKSDIFGEVNIGAELDRTNENDRWIGSIFDFTLPLFHQNQGEIEKAKYELIQSKKSYKALEHEYKIMFAKTLNNLKHKERMLDIYNTDVLKTKAQIEKINEELSDKMQINKVKIIESKINAVNLKSKYLEIIRDLWINHAELQSFY